MALDPEELRRQHLLRQQQRQARQAGRRKQYWRLGAAAAALLCVIVAVLLIAGGCSDRDGVQTEPPADTVIHLAAAGDLNITDAVVASGGDGYSYTQAFLDVGHLLADADVSVLNLEGSVVGAPYGTESASAPEGLLQALRSIGLDYVQLANSYSISHGVSGLSRTIDAVRAAGMEPLGVYASQADYAAGKGFTLCQVGDVRIALAAFTKGMDGMALPSGSENCVNVLYEDYSSTYQSVNTERITAVLSAAREAKPDIIVAFVHWGSEFNDTVSTSQQKIVQLMQQQGVDAIIGTHSHYVQKMAYDAQTGQFVAYCLGDFFGDAARAGSEYSVVLDLEITKSAATGDAKITGYSYTPIFTVSQDGEPLRVMRIHETMAAFDELYIERIGHQTYEAMQYALTRIEKRIAGE